jgi:hypothetical protein
MNGGLRLLLAPVHGPFRCHVWGPRSRSLRRGRLEITVRAAVGYSLPALLGTLLAAPRRRQLLFIGDGAFQMTAQELSTILRRGLLVNNNGYTISFSARAPDTMISINGDMPKPLRSSTLKVRRSLTGSAPKTNWRTLWRQYVTGERSC